MKSESQKIRRENGKSGLAGEGRTVHVRLNGRDLADLDEWIATRKDAIKRPEAVRRLIRSKPKARGQDDDLNDPKEYYRRALEYSDAAVILFRSHPVGTLWLPAANSLANSLELGLKGFLLEHDVDLETTRSLGHDLIKAFERATKLGLVSDNDALEYAARKLGVFHMSHSARYPKKEKVKLGNHIEKLVSTVRSFAEHALERLAKS